jgi:uncharacterized MAPEG superfamily protein
MPDQSALPRPFINGVHTNHKKGHLSLIGRVVYRICHIADAALLVSFMQVIDQLQLFVRQRRS